VAGPAEARAECKRLSSLLLKSEAACRDTAQQLQQARRWRLSGRWSPGSRTRSTTHQPDALQPAPAAQDWADLLPVSWPSASASPNASSGAFPTISWKDHLPQLIADMEMAANRVVKIVFRPEKLFAPVEHRGEVPLEPQHRGAQRAAAVQSTLRKAGWRSRSN